MFCVNCGKELLPNAKFCHDCGFQVPTAPSYQQDSTHSDGQIRIIENPNPIFRMSCEYCCCVFEYQLSNLGYRAWYPNGFVYCPSCKRPLRHKLQYRIK